MKPRPLVACVWVRGHVPYPVEYLSRFVGMVHRWLPDCDIVCLTDQPRRVPAGMVAVPIPSPGTLPGWWAKVRLFDPSLLPREVGRRVLYLDLDTLVVGPLADLLWLAPFTLAEHGGRFRGAHGRAIVPRFNSSVMAWTVGQYAGIWRTWSPAVADRLWGDQDWIGELMPDGAATFPAAWTPRLSDVLPGRPGPEARVVISKKPKNAEAARRWAWFDAAWGAAPVPALAGGGQ